MHRPGGSIVSNMADRNPTKTPPKGKAADAKGKQKEETFWDKVAAFDRLVYAKDYKQAAPRLLTMLGLLEKGTQSFGVNLADTSPLVERQATIFCAAITRMLSDTDFRLDDKTFLSAASLKRAMMQAFEISGYRGTDHLLQSIGTRDDKGQTTFTRQELIKLFLGLSVNALTPNLVNILLRQPPDMAWPLCLGFLSEQIVYSKNGQMARPRILEAVDLLKQASPTHSMVRNIGPAYMGCSYDESENKHAVKKAMNHVVRGWLDSLGVEDAKLPEPRRPVKKRPTVLVLAELYDSRHAMHRCYGPSIAALKPHFKTILMTPSGQIDDRLVDMFDKIDPQKFNAENPKAFIDKAKSYRADIVYFPSIGMRLMSILGSNVRIAPIQLFTPGHPATTYSKMMDYIVIMEGCYGNKNCYSEKVILREDKPYFEMRHDAVPVRPEIRSKPDTVRIAVPSWSRKVSPGFIAACRTIQRLAAEKGKKVEFWFFPNAVGSLYQGFGRRIKAILNARVFPRTNYNSYIARLNECDIFLSTFPFGATNSLVDAAIQGLPMVNLKGPEAHSMNDSDMLKSIDQPSWLSAENVGDYISAALKLILSDDERVRISEAILACDPGSKFLAANAEDMNDFPDIFMKLYKHHDQIQGASQAVWNYEDLLSLEAP